MTLERTYDAGVPLPILTPLPGESAAALHQRRIAAANKQSSGVDYSSIIADFQKREKDALKANKAREKEIRGTYSDLIARSEGGGAARVAGLAEIEKSKTKAIGAGTQQMISSGLYGTTTAASIPVQAENAASLSRLKLEDMLEQRTQDLKLGKAGFAERIETPYPDYSMLLNAMVAQGSR